MQSPDIQETEDLRNKAFLLPSLIILLCLILQGGTTFKLWCSPDALPFLPKIKAACDPTLYPFLTYPMFSSTHKLGDSVSRYYLYANLENNTKVLIEPSDFGFVKDQDSYWLFRLHVLLPLRYKDKGKITDFVEAYEAKNQEKIYSLKLEVHPLTLTKNGHREESRKVVKVFKIEDYREKR